MEVSRRDAGWKRAERAPGASADAVRVLADLRAAAAAATAAGAANRRLERGKRMADFMDDARAPPYVRSSTHFDRIRSDIDVPALSDSAMEQLLRTREDPWLLRLRERERKRADR